VKYATMLQWHYIELGYVTNMTSSLLCYTYLNFKLNNMFLCGRKAKVCIIIMFAVAGVL
jgi:hypothetical protein